MAQLKYQFALLAFIFSLTLLLPAQAAVIEPKKPADVYQRVMLFKQQVEQLRSARGVADPWPEAQTPNDMAPRHVFEKALEILDKIKRLRRANKMGPIAVPYFPTREITPNEVYDIAGRLQEELKLFPELSGFKLTPVEKTIGITPSDVYRQLQEISFAINPLLGVRGLTPTDVYLQSIKVVEQVKFLRISQSLPLDIPKPQKTTGKHPNHSLQQAYKLIEKISTAQHNLWIPPITTPSLPKREITPGEVHNTLLIVQAELERIKFRLGIERPIELEEVTGRKSPDDVLQNLKWATQMMPQFSAQDRLIQYPNSSLVKNANHLYALAEHITKELGAYRNQRGIRAGVAAMHKQADLQPHHVYQKIHQVMHKVNEIRKQVGLGKLAISPKKMRRATLTEVYDQLLRLDLELGFIYEKTGMKARIMDPGSTTLYDDKTPSDVYRQIQTISHLMDAILAQDEDPIQELWALSQTMIEDIKIITRSNQRQIDDIALPEIQHRTQAADMEEISSAILKTMDKLKRRIGLIDTAVPILSLNANPTYDNVFKEVELAIAELEHIKIFLNIEQVANPVITDGEKTVDQVRQQLELAQQMLQKITE